MVRTDWDEVNRRLDGAHPREILRWAVETFYPRLTMATAFGPEGCAILHMLAEIEPRVRVFNLDTGYQFAETLALRDRIAERYGIEVELVRPDTTVAEYEATHGGPLYVVEPGPVLPRPQDRPAAAGGRGLRRLDLGDPRRPVGAPGEGVGGRLGRQVRAGEGQPAAELDAPRRLGVRGGQQGAVQPAARPGLSVDRLLALHPGRSRPARTSGPAAGPARPRPSAACTRWTAASSRPAGSTP